MTLLLNTTVVWAAAFALVCPAINVVVAQEDVIRKNESDAPNAIAKPADVAWSCGCCKSGGAAQTSPIILALDIDKDGQISAAEIRNAAVSLQALDSDGDGNLNSHEIHAQSKFPITNSTKRSNLILGVTRDYYAERMLLRDTNKNGQLEMAEMNGPTLAILDVIDSNGDLILSYEELRDINKPQPSPLTQPNNKRIQKNPNLRSSR